MATLDKTTLKRTESQKTIIYTSATEKSILGKSKTFSKRLGKKLGETWEKLRRKMPRNLVTVLLKNVLQNVIKTTMIWSQEKKKGRKIAFMKGKRYA